MPRVPIIGGDRVSTSTDYRDALPENMTIVNREILGARGYALSHSGLTLHATGEGIDRGGFWNDRFNKHFRVSSTSLIELDASGGTTVIGDITGTKRASMTESFNTQAIVADGKMWLYNNTSLNEVTDPNLGAPIDITWIDGYYFLTDGEFLYHTDLNDETSIDPLKFATAEFSPDATLAVDKTIDNQVIVFGRYSIEYFINRATDNFAFQRIAGKSQTIGVVGTHCAAEMDGVFFILGGSKYEAPTVYAVTGGRSTSISTREIDKIISSYVEDELADAVLETRIEDRDQFIIVRLPRDTLLYNHTIGGAVGAAAAWTRVKTAITDSNVWCAANGVFDPRVSKWIYGDIQNSNIGILDSTTAAQYGNQVESILYTPFIDVESVSIDELEVDILPGNQANTDDVKMSVSLTYDGLTYGLEWFDLYGSNHAYSTRYTVRRLGYVRNFFGVKLRVVSKSRVNVAGMNIEYG